MKSAAIIFIARIIAALSSIGLLIITTQIGGEEGRGAIAMVTAQLTWSLLFPGILSTPMAHYTRKVSAVEGIIGTVILTSIGAVLSQVFWPDSINGASSEISIRVLFVLWLFATSFYQFLAQHLLGRRKVISFAVGVAAVPLLTFLFLFLVSSGLLFINSDLLELYIIFSLVCTIFVFVGLVLWHARATIDGLRMRALSSIREPLSKGWRAQTTNGLQFLNYRIVLYLVAYQALGDAGILSIAMAIGESTWLLSQSLAAAILSTTASGTNPYQYKKLAGRRSSELGLVVATVLVVLYFLIPLHPFLFKKNLPSLQHVFFAYAPGVLAIAIISPLAAWWGGQARFISGFKGSIVGTVFLGLSWLILRPTELSQAAVCISVGHCANALVVLRIFYAEKPPQSVKDISNA